MNQYHIDVRTILCCIRQCPEWYVFKNKEKREKYNHLIRIYFVIIRIDYQGHLLSKILTNICTLF